MQANTPIVKHLVLLGGGHSHLAVLKYLGMNPVPGLAVTLISRDINTPYSGSLPGLISGVYEHGDIHIDLRPLAQFAGARLIQEEVCEIDLVNRRLTLQSRPTLEFDLLSLNVGSKPDAYQIPGAIEHAIGIKPIDLFLRRWQEIFAAAISSIREQSSEYTLVIVGGGPASVELAFSTQVRVHSELGIKSAELSKFKLKIVSADAELLKLHNQSVRHFARAELERRGIEILLQHTVSAFTANAVICENGTTISADAIVYATGASIPQWLLKSGLNITEDGFIEVNKHLQTTSHDFVFAAGDAATIKGTSRPKSGVYAVRQGNPLAQNLVRFATGRSLKSYHPQRHALALMSMGEGKAIASRHRLFYQGALVWRIKHHIDSNFIRKYSELPVMTAPLALASGLVDKTTEQQLQAHAMRCAGCGAKVAGNVLEEVLRQLPAIQGNDILSGHSSVEDASMIKLGDGRVLLQSVDQIRAFINDPWLFARIATNHCLSDIYAMGALPHSALAVVGLPFASRKYARAQLKELMLACSAALQENHCELIGGHSAESSDLSFGLCVNGFIAEDKLLTKSGMNDGDILILTKPLGTGTLLAADMRYLASHENIDAALKQMARSSRDASICIVKHGATACTDITGFGLAGHLLEMLSADNVEAEVSLADIPALDGALEHLQQAIFSSLHEDNKQVEEHITCAEELTDDARYDLLFDPQTAGGLLACIPEAAAESCLEELRELGYGRANMIGRIARCSAQQAAILLK
ncbi:MAG: selenide, water dikinase SelD [Proteobacteria bacterium]|nr:selenide, water dikinase SelD [Pseudomonadota bacterium]